MSRAIIIVDPPGSLPFTLSAPALHGAHSNYLGVSDIHVGRSRSAVSSIGGMATVGDRKRCFGSRGRPCARRGHPSPDWLRLAIGIATGRALPSTWEAVDAQGAR